MPNSQKGAAHLLLIVAALGLLAFLLITNTFSFKDRLFDTLFPKPPSHAATNSCGSLNLSSTFNSIGIEVLGNTATSATLKFKKSTDNNLSNGLDLWQAGGSLYGSALLLDSGTDYEIEVTPAGGSALTCSIATRPDNIPDINSLVPGPTSGPSSQPLQPLYSDNFDSGTLDTNNWVMEAQTPCGNPPVQPCTTVNVLNGKLNFESQAQTTLWFKPQLSGNIQVEYDVTPILGSPKGPNDNVRDVNQYFMASDPNNPNLFPSPPTRNGTQGQYNCLKLYYVGFGQNNNTITWFTKYPGSPTSTPGICNQPASLQTNPTLLTANKTYHIMTKFENGKFEYWVDGVKFFDYNDPASPYSSGNFAFRNTENHAHIDNFIVYQINSGQTPPPGTPPPGSNYYYVTSSASGSGNGSQTNPWTLQQAVTSAPANAVVEVAPGYYKPAGTRTSPITLKAKFPAVDDQRNIINAGQHSVIEPNMVAGPTGASDPDITKKGPWQSVTLTGPQTGASYQAWKWTGGGSGIFQMGYSATRDGVFQRIAHWKSNNCTPDPANNMPCYNWTLTTPEGWAEIALTNKLYNFGFINFGSDIYLRLPGDANPNNFYIMGSNGTGIGVSGDDIRISGFELREFKNAINFGSSAHRGIVDHNLTVSNKSGVFFSGNKPSTYGSDHLVERNLMMDTGIWTDDVVNRPSIAWKFIKQYITLQDGTLYSANRIGEESETTALHGSGGAQRVVIRYNTIDGHFNGIGGYNKDFDRYATQDYDIHDNYITHISDDAFEPEGQISGGLLSGSINWRIWNNRIENNLDLLSTGPLYYGPVYLFRNQAWKTGTTQGSGTGPKGEYFKYSGDSTPPAARVYVINNTFWSDSASVDTAGQYASGGPNPEKFYLRNNIMRSTRYASQLPGCGASNDSNYNHYATTDPNRGTQGCFGPLDNQAGSATNASLVDNAFNNINTGDLTLKSGSVFENTGTIVPNIADNFTGSAPDIGTCEGSVCLASVGSGGTGATPPPSSTSSPISTPTPSPSPSSLPSSTPSPSPSSLLSLPSITIIKPTDGATVSGNVPITTSTNTVVTKVEFYVDNNLKATDTSSPFSHTWDSTRFSNGNHTLKAIAYDILNNSALDTVLVNASNAVSSPTPTPAGGTGDVTPPSVSISSPSDGLQVTGAVTIDATASDTGGYGNTGTGISKVEFYVDNNLLSTDNTSPYSTSWDTSSLAQGATHSLTAKAYDNATPAINSATSSVVSVAIADTNNPFVTLTEPANGSTLLGNVTIQASASDNVGVTKVDLFIDTNLASSFTSSPYIFSWDTTAVLDGNHTIKATAYDGANNSSSTATSVIVQNADISPPTEPTNLQATNTTYDKVDLSWSASTDDRGLGGYYMVRNGTTIGQTTAVTYSDTTVLENTQYIYSVIAFDTSNNLSTPSSTITLTTPLSPDTQAPSAPANLTAQAVSTSQINLFWSPSTDNRGVASYDVFRNNAKVATVTTCLSGPSTCTYGDGSLSASTPYSYYLVAKDAAGNTSVASNTAFATTQTPVTTGNIIGKVTNTSLTPLAGASVKLTLSNGTTQTYPTDSQGSYTITNITAGTYNVTYSATNYVAQTISVIVTAGQTTTQNVNLVSTTGVNLVKNPGCESNTSGWVGFQAKISKNTSTPHSGLANCRVAYAGSGGFYTIDDQPSTVSKPLSGRVYAAGAWVRAGSSSALGKPVKLVLRQKGGSSAQKDTNSPQLTLNNSWQQLTVSTTIDKVGRTDLEVSFVQDSATLGNSFLVDDISLVLQ